MENLRSKMEVQMVGQAVRPGGVEIQDEEQRSNLDQEAESANKVYVFGPDLHFTWCLCTCYFGRYDYLRHL